MQKNKTNQKAKKALIAVLAVFLSVVILFVSLMFVNVGQTEKISPNNFVSSVGQTIVCTTEASSTSAPPFTMLYVQDFVNKNSDNAENSILYLSVSMTSDLIPVLYSSDYLDKYTDAREYYWNKKNKLSSKTYDELRKLNFAEYFVDSNGKKTYQGLRNDNIPDEIKATKFEDVIIYLSIYGKFKLFINISDSGSLAENAIDKIYSMLKYYDYLPYTVINGNSDVCKYIDENYPSLPRTASDREMRSLYLSCLFSLKLNKSSVHYSAVFSNASYTPIIRFDTKKVINYLHKYDIAILYNNPKKSKVGSLKSKKADVVFLK